MSAASYLLSAQNNLFIKVAYFLVVYFDPLQYLDISKHLCLHNKLTSPEPDSSLSGMCTMQHVANAYK